MKTSGSVHGKIIMESPARYAIISQEGYDNSCPALIAVSFVIPNIPPRKINENNANTITIRLFFAIICSDTY
jgi:hypothetical protein